MKAIVNEPMDTIAIKSTPNNLVGTIRSIWNTGKKCPSDDISKGVAEGFASSPITNGSILERVEVDNRGINHFEKKYWLIPNSCISFLRTLGISIADTPHKLSQESEFRL